MVAEFANTASAPRMPILPFHFLFEEHWPVFQKVPLPQPFPSPLARSAPLCKRLSLRRVPQASSGSGRD